MTLTENYDALKRQCETLGFVNPNLESRLREELLSGKDHTSFHFREIEGELITSYFLNLTREGNNKPYQFDDYDAILTRNGDQILASRSFSGEVPLQDAKDVLAKDALGKRIDTEDNLWVLKPKGVTEYLHEAAPAQINYWKTLKNQHTMNEENFNYLKDNLKYLGFEDKLNGPLSENMSQQAPEFQLYSQVPHYDEKAMDYTLHFKKSESSDRYFFNRYDATLSNGHAEEAQSQTFYINKGHGVTAKEAFNLLEGRAVYKTLQNKEGQKYNVWMQLDFENKDKHGNYQVKTFHDKYNFKLEKALDKYNIQELHDPEKKADLLKSMQKGNTQQVTAVVDGKEVKAFVEALPEKRGINFYNEKMKLQDTAVYLKTPVKKDLAQEKAEKEAQKQAEGQTQGRKKSRGVHH